MEQGADEEREKRKNSGPRDLDFFFFFLNPHCPLGILIKKVVIIGVVHMISSYQPFVLLFSR